VSNSANRPGASNKPGKPASNKPASNKPASNKPATSKLTAASFEDLPEAVRETKKLPKPRRKLPIWQLSLVGLGGLVLIVTIVTIARLLTPTTPKIAENIAANAQFSPNPNDIILGHYPYTEAPEAELEPINGDGGIRLRKSAAQAYQAMVAEAQTAGVNLTPLSAFRSVKEQETVFFGVKQERSQTTTQRADVSAPPGHSEHHTGYAIDMGDGNVPATHLSPEFENTEGFKWLQANAPKYNFELSFPKDNKQGVTYEPWHWRYVGDRESLETFFKAKNK
jgi:zinc D-Ala-D-Ala carboxypeptidase